MFGTPRRCSLCGGLILLGLLVCPVYQGHAANPNLFLSAESLQFNNSFAGAQVIEVVVIDDDFEETHEKKGEPDVTIDGNILRMAQNEVGRWHGFFAILDKARLADQIALDGGVDGKGLDFGVFVNSDTPGSVLWDVAADSSPPFFTESQGVAVPRAGGLTQFANGTQPAVLPTGAGVIENSPMINNVVRDATVVNLDSNTNVAGQIGLNPDTWPMVQLFTVTTPAGPSGQPVTVQYHPGRGTQTAVLNYNPSLPASIEVDKQGYLPGDDILLTVIDPHLNIDPTAPDSWTFQVTEDTATFYQAFDADGQPDANGTAGLVDITPHLDDLDFINHGVLTVDIGAGIELVASGLQPSTSVNDGSGTVYDQIVTMAEVGPNSGTFISYEQIRRSESGPSALRIADDALPGLAGTITYGGQTIEIMVIPEPSSFAVLAIGGVLSFIRRRSA